MMNGFSNVVIKDKAEQLLYGGIKSIISCS
jgi:hypothetical protein